MGARRSAAVLAAVGLGVLGLTALPAAAAPGRTASSPAPNRSNVGNTHSPQLLRQLAGVTAGPVINGPRAAATAGPVNGAPQGVDVASFQHPSGAAINWATAFTGGIKFAAVKATEGDYYTNPYAAGDLTQAQAAGLTVAAYAFAIPNGNGSSASPVVQADYLLNFLTAKFGSASAVPVLLDIEYQPAAYGSSECYGLSQSAMVSWIAGFDNEIRAKTGRFPLIYTPKSWWATCTGSSTAFGQLPVWIPDYSNSSPGLPAGWSTWNLWQYTSSGTVAGFPAKDAGAVDLDQLNPGIVTLLNPGTRHSPAGSAITALPVKPFTVSPAPTLTYSASGLPPGLAIDSGTGTITGTPSSPGSYPVTVTAADSGATGSASFTWDAYGTITITPVPAQTTVAGSAISRQVQVADSVTGQTPVVTASGLPPGLSISSGRLITGWPDTPGSYQVTVRASDSLGASQAATFGWAVTAAPDRGPAGAVRLNLAGKCLNDVGNSTANGTAQDIWTCNGSTAQKWTVVKDGTLRIHGKCLDVYHGGKTNGTKVDLFACNGSAAQQWQVRTRGQLVNPQSGKCLTDPKASTKNGTRVQIWACTGKNYQKWVLPAGPVLSLLPGKCLDDSGNRTGNGNKIDLWGCTGGAAQQWTALPDGTVRIHGKCLDVYHGGTASGTKVDLFACNGSAAQKWWINAAGSGAALVSPASHLCLTAPARVNGTGIQIATCAGLPGQNWRIQ